jgi:hypothetical protein
MPFLTTIGSTSVSGFGTSYKAPAEPAPASVKYFYNSVSNLWSNISNWFNNSAHTEASQTFPSQSEDAQLLSTSLVFLDSSYDAQSDTVTSWQTNSSAYWAGGVGPLSIIGTDVDLTFESESFLNHYEGEFSTQVTYGTGDVVHYTDGHYYIAKENPTPGENPDSSTSWKDFGTHPYIYVDITLTNGNVTLNGVDFSD